MKLPFGYEAHIVPRKYLLQELWHYSDKSHGSDWQLLFKFGNDQWGMPVIAMRDTTIHKNDRICQFRITQKQPDFEFTEVECLDTKSRGGFGSTGKR